MVWVARPERDKLNRVNSFFFLLSFGSWFQNHITRDFRGSKGNGVSHLFFTKKIRRKNRAFYSTLRIRWWELSPPNQNVTNLNNVFKSIKKKLLFEQQKKIIKQSSVTFFLLPFAKDLIYTKAFNSKKNHKVSKKRNIKKNENKEEGKEEEEGERYWNYGKEESIKYEVGFFSEKAPEKKDAPQLRREPPCTPSSSQQSKSPATFFSFFSFNGIFLVFLFSVCFLIRLYLVIYIVGEWEVKTRGVCLLLSLRSWYFFWSWFILTFLIYHF